MIYSYKECLKISGSNYLLRKALSEGTIYKLKNGLYSDRKTVKDIEIFLKKYKNIVFTMESALYYLGISDVVPDKYVIATDKDSTKIKDNDIKQYFVNGGLSKVGLITINHNGVNLPVYNKERMLIEVIRYKNKLTFDYYKEVIGYYRAHIDELDIPLVLEYLEEFPKKKLITKTIQLEVL